MQMHKLSVHNVFNMGKAHYIIFNFDLDSSESPEVAVYFPDYATSSPTEEYLKIQVTDNQMLYGSNMYRQLRHIF